MRAETGSRSRVTLRDLQHPRARFQADVRAGLSASPPRISPKYFYDDRGALLFEEITRLDDYYLTRTEMGILQASIGEIAQAIGPGARLVEFGSGSGLKTRLLLRHLEQTASYVPIDISRAQLVEVAVTLADEFPELTVTPICADYTGHWALPPAGAGVRRTVAFFPGSTIGNFEPAEAATFLRTVGTLCGRGGGMLVGVDLHKERAVLERAYDDPQGLTAAFNLNLLHRINRECGADIDPDAFRHHAFYDERNQRIEMRLVCERAVRFVLPGPDMSDAPTEFRFDPEDFIHTEYSYKYTIESFRRLAEATGWTRERVWTDDRLWFSVWLLRRTP